MFQIIPLASDKFSHLFGLSDEVLEQQGIVPMIADAKPGYPCRVSLDFAEVGERLLLLNHQHHDVATPYRSNYAIFVRDGGRDIKLEAGQLAPVLIRDTPVAVRAFDKSGMLKSAELVQGPQSAAVFERLLAQDNIDYLHVHFAAYGCYALKVIRA